MPMHRLKEYFAVKKQPHFQKYSIVLDLAWRTKTDAVLFSWHFTRVGMSAAGAKQGKNILHCTN